MSNIQFIRKIKLEDRNEIINIWLNTNIEVHNFINPEYWKRHIDKLEKQLLNLNGFVYDNNGVKGFIIFDEEYIDKLYIKKDERRNGIGKKLIDIAKTNYSELKLYVYKKNKKAVNFYLKQGFVIESEELEELVKELGYLMSWKK